MKIISKYEWLNEKIEMDEVFSRQDGDFTNFYDTHIFKQTADEELKLVARVNKKTGEIYTY